MEFFAVGVMYTVILCVADCNIASIHQVLGDQMCKIKCETTLVCKFAFYDITRLMCKLADEEENSDPTNFRYRWIYVQEPVKTCRGTVDERHNVTMKKRRDPTKAINASIRAERRNRSWPALLVVQPTNDGASPFYKVNVKDKTIKAYPYFNFSDVTAVAYVSDLRLVLVCTRSPNRIVSAKLDTYEKAETLKNGISVCSMTVDQRMLIVFLGLVNSSLCRMSLHDHALTMYYLGKHIYPEDLAVDSGKRVYAACQDQLLLLSYELKILKTLDRGKKIMALTLSLDNKLLYYQKRKYIYKLQMSDSSIHAAVKVRSRYAIIKSMVNLNESLYITYSVGKRTHLLDVVSVKHSTQTNSYILPFRDGATLCPVQ